MADQKQQTGTMEEFLRKLRELRQIAGSQEFQQQAQQELGPIADVVGSTPMTLAEAGQVVSPMQPTRFVDVPFRPTFTGAGLGNLLRMAAPGLFEPGAFFGPQSFAPSMEGGGRTGRAIPRQTGGEVRAPAPQPQRPRRRPTILR